MDAQTPDFAVEVDGVNGRCPAGETYAARNIADRKTPILSCEGP